MHDGAKQSQKSLGEGGRKEGEGPVSGAEVFISTERRTKARSSQNTSLH